MEIALSNGGVAIIDDADFPLVDGRTWRRVDVRSGLTSYATTAIRVDGRKITVQMHRLLTGAAQGTTVDHRDLDGLNNRRDNLRCCTTQQNARNRRRHANNSVGFKGVARDRGGRFRAIIMVDGRQLSLGGFGNAIEAAVAYDRAAIRHFGDFARLNFGPDRDWLLPYPEQSRASAARLTTRSRS